MKRTMKTIQLGDVFPTRQGGFVTVVNIVNNCNITVKHNDRYEYTHVVYLGNLNKSEVKSPYYPNVYGVGYIGLGPYMSRINNRMTKEYQLWADMLKRCYSVEHQIAQPTYIGCAVHPCWHNFQNFADWYHSHPDCGKEYHLDKDILYYNNKIYGPDTCTLVPFAINNLFKVTGSISANDGHLVGVRPRDGRYRSVYNSKYTGTHDTREQAHEAYLVSKRNHILSVAEQYRHQVTVDVYYSTIALAYSI